MGYCAFLQGIFPTQGLNLSLSNCRQILYCLSHQGSPLESPTSFKINNSKSKVVGKLQRPHAVFFGLLVLTFQWSKIIQCRGSQLWQLRLTKEVFFFNALVPLRDSNLGDPG